MTNDVASMYWICVEGMISLENTNGTVEFPKIDVQEITYSENLTSSS